MRILVVSDSHGNYYQLKKAVAAQPKAELIVHLGDGEEEAQRIKLELPPTQMLIQLRGNNDWGSRMPVSEELTLEEKRIFMTHGHTYQVKSGFEQVIRAARKREADILLFGHTHQSYTAYVEGLYIMNPGSLSYGAAASYGVIDITQAGVVTNIITMKR